MGASQFKLAVNCNVQDCQDEFCLPGNRPESLTTAECAELLLVQSIIRGDVDDVRRAVLQGANIECIHGNMTPLMRACAFGHADVVLYLVTARADCTARSSGQWTPLYYALSEGELEIAWMLLDYMGEAAEDEKALARASKAKILKQCECSEQPDAVVNLKLAFEEGGRLAKQTQDLVEWHGESADETQSYADA